MFGNAVYFILLYPFFKGSRYWSWHVGRTCRPSVSSLCSGAVDSINASFWAIYVIRSYYDVYPLSSVNYLSYNAHSWSWLECVSFNSFETVVQGDAGATRKHEGTGLGLSICSGLANSLGGTVFASSKVHFSRTFY